MTVPYVLQGTLQTLSEEASLPCLPGFLSPGFITLPRLSAGRCWAAPVRRVHAHAGAQRGSRAGPNWVRWWDMAPVHPLFTLPSERCQPHPCQGCQGASAHGRAATPLRPVLSALRARHRLRTNTFYREAEAATSSAGAGAPQLSPASRLPLALLSLSLQEEQAQCGGAAGAESSCHSRGYNRVACG